MNINLTLFGQMVTFAFFVWFCMKFVWPVIIEAMEERQKKIADGLDAADRALRDLELAQNKATDQMKEAKQEAPVLLIKPTSEPIRLLMKLSSRQSQKATASKLLLRQI